MKDSVSVAAPSPGDTSRAGEPLEPQDKKCDTSMSIPLLPPPTITVKTEVKKEEPEDDGKANDEEQDYKDGPCTKMTMRLRRNINNPQCVSRPVDAQQEARLRSVYVMDHIQSWRQWHSVSQKNRWESSNSELHYA